MVRFYILDTPEMGASRRITAITDACPVWRSQWTLQQDNDGTRYFQVSGNPLDPTATFPPVPQEHLLRVTAVIRISEGFCKDGRYEPATPQRNDRNCVALVKTSRTVTGIDSAVEQTHQWISVTGPGLQSVKDFLHLLLQKQPGMLYHSDYSVNEGPRPQMPVRESDVDWTL